MPIKRPPVSAPSRRSAASHCSLLRVSLSDCCAGTAHDDGRFVNTTHEHVAQRCGTYLPGHKSYVEMNISEPSHEALGLDARARGAGVQLRDAQLAQGLVVEWLR